MSSLWLTLQLPAVCEKYTQVRLAWLTARDNNRLMNTQTNQHTLINCMAKATVAPHLLQGFCK
jgi:hypothetical protein